MPRHALTIRGIGENVCWLLVQQAIGIPDAKMPSDYMSGKVALLMFAQPALPERLCVTAAMRQMGGTTIYQGEDGSLWRTEVSSFQQHLLPIFGYYLDCLYVYSIPVASVDVDCFAATFPVINAGSPDAHPAHALADIALMLKRSGEMKYVSAAWIGCDNGTLHSLVEATAWFPFSLRIALPPQIDPSFLKKRVDELKTDVVFVKSPREAARDVDYIYAGCHGGLSENELKGWSVEPSLLNLAKPNAKLMLSASPIRAIPIAPEILASKASQLLHQAEFRLRIHKRILHWVFETQK